MRSCRHGDSGTAPGRSQTARRHGRGRTRGGRRAGPQGPPAVLAHRAGRAAFAEWIDRVPGPENIRFPLLLTIAFGRHLPAERLAGFVAQHRALHADRLAGYERQQAGATAAADRADPYALATLSFGVAYERAALVWFDQLPPEIRGSGDWPAAASPEPLSSPPV